MRWYERLRRQAEIAYVRRRGRRSSTVTLAGYAAEIRAERPRVGVTVAKTVGKAVVRNRVRRQVRGALDALGPVLPPRTALLVIARPEAGAASYAGIAADVAALVAALAQARSAK